VAKQAGMMEAEILRFMVLKRVFYVLGGTSVALSVAILVGSVTVGADVAWSLPSPFRLCSLVVVLGGGVWCLCRYTILPFLTFRHHRAIVEIEARNLGLGQSLRTATELAEREDLPAGVSPALAAALVADTEAQLQHMQMSALIPWARMATGLSVFAVSMLIAAVAMLSWHDFRTGSERLLHPVAPITFTNVTATCDRFLSDVGRPVTFQAALTGRPTEDVTLHLRENDENWQEIRMEVTDKGDYTATWTGTKVAACEWFVTAGDGATRPATLRVVVYPRVVAASARLEFPAYTRLPERQVEGGDMEAVEGTRAQALFTMNRELVWAGIRLATGESVPGRILGLSVEATLPVALGENAYWLEGEDGEGLAIEPREYMLRGLADRPPRIDILVPPATSEVTKTTEVPVRIRVRDDFGVGTVRIVARIKGKDHVLAVTTGDGTDHKQVLSHAVLMLEDHELTYRDQVAVFAEAGDFMPERSEPGVSAIHYLDIRPFLRHYQQGESPGSAEPEEGMALEQLVKWQRKGISQTFRAAHERNPAPDATSQLADSQKSLLEATRNFRELIGTTPNVPPEAIEHIVPHLTDAEQDMTAAVEALQTGDLDPARTSQEDALNDLLQARMEMVSVRAQSSEATSQMRSIDEQILPEIEPPAELVEARRELSELAREAEELAGTERDIETSLSDTPQTSTGAAEESPAERQQQAAARGEALRRHVADNPAATDLVRQRATEAEAAMRGASKRLEAGDETAAKADLHQAADRLQLLSEHLNKLASEEPAERLEQARSMAAEMARSLAGDENQPEAPQSSDPGAHDAETGTGSGGRREDAAEDARTLQDVVSDLAGLARQHDVDLAERLDELAQRQGLDHLPQDIARADQARDGGEGERANQLEEASAERLKQLSQGLARERRRLEQGYLQRLSAAEREASELRGDVATEAAGGGGTVPFSTIDRLGELGKEVSSLGDEELTRTATILLHSLEDGSTSAWGPGGIVVPEELGGEALGPMIDRLQELIQDVMRDQLPTDSDERVPDEYIRLVERYYRALSDDLR